MKNTLLLDALGTMIELKPPAPRLRAELAARGIEISEAEAHKAMAAEIDYYKEHMLDGGNVRGLKELRERCTSVLAVELPEHARIASLGEVLLASLKFAPYPEVQGVLGALRARGFQVVVVSNFDISLNQILKDTGLDELVDGVVVSAERGIEKPNPLIFSLGLSVVRSTAAHAFHVGDDLVKDVQGAQAARIDAVYLDRADSSEAPEGVPRITTLRGLLDLAGN
jgi:putative hydrolase of the HAD superfamily